MQIQTICLAILIVTLACAVHAADMPGSRDHPLIPRVAGSDIYGYASSAYDAGTMIVTTPDGKPVADHPEGTRTRILYLTKPGDTPLMVQKNYEAALQDLGKVEEAYACRDKACNAHFLSTNLWSRDAMIPDVALKQAFYLLAFTHNYTSPAYRYARVVKDDSLFHVGVFTALMGQNNPNVEARGRTAVLVEVLEVKDFKPTLEFVDAAEMQTAIGSKGHIALYGIQFDHDKDTLRPDSQATIAEITKILQQDPALRLYVVGHTDDVGDLAYNQDLSLRRARSVVAALVADGTAAARLLPLGVGPAAPVGSNDSEDGRALNRRVELVKRQ